MKLAGIYAQVGDVDRAVGLLEELVKKPGVAHYGLLTLDEVWDPLRRDARFEKIMADLAPK